MKIGWHELGVGERITVVGIFVTVVLGVIGIIGGLIYYLYPRSAGHTVLVSLAKEMQSPHDWCFRDDAQHSAASLKLKGVTATSNNGQSFIQCGDPVNPRLVSGLYRFEYYSFPHGSEVTGITALAGVDEGSARSQHGTRVAWTVTYDGHEICHRHTVYGHPIRMDCQVDIQNPDLTSFKIVQRGRPSSTEPYEGVYAGMIDPTVDVKEP